MCFWTITIALDVFKLVLLVVFCFITKSCHSWCSSILYSPFPFKFCHRISSFVGALFCVTQVNLFVYYVNFLRDYECPVFWFQVAWFLWLLLVVSMIFHSIIKRIAFHNHGIEECAWATLLYSYFNISLLWNSKEMGPPLLPWYRCWKTRWELLIKFVFTMKQMILFFLVFHYPVLSVPKYCAWQGIYHFYILIHE